MSNLDTPKAIIIAALILSLSAIIVFMFRYNYAVRRSRFVLTT